MDNHLTDVQINVLAHFENKNTEYFTFKVGEVNTYKNHINSCDECKKRFIESNNLYKELNKKPAFHLYKYVAAILILCTFGIFQFGNTADYSQNFVLNEELEEIIGEEFRSIPIEVIQPKLNENFTNEIQFKIDMPLEGIVILKIFDNNESSIYEKEIKSLNFKIDELTIPGLYYWRIDSPDDILYHGKFYYKKPN